MRLLTVGICLLYSSWSYSNDLSTKSRIHPNNLFIKLKTGHKLTSSSLIKNSRKLIGNLFLVNSSNPNKLIKELKDHNGIEYIQRDFYGLNRLFPKLELLHKKRIKNDSDFIEYFNDPMVSKLWGFKETGMDVFGAYDILPNRPAEEVIVAVVDTGVDHNHEDLKDMMWINSKEIPNDGIDNDKNGYIDDIYGINTLVRDSSRKATMNTMASHWHGTHVAGTIAANQNNGIGISGVAKNAKIMAIRTVPDNADELDSDIVEAFIYAAKMGAKIINCSFGKETNEGGMVVRDVINQIGEKFGTLVIAAAGNNYGNDNDIKLHYPSSFDSENLLVVASSTYEEDLSEFSNIGVQTVDLAAPGSDIYSTINGSKYAYASGTSMAAPNASGAAALIWGHYPHLTASELKQLIMETVTKVSAFQGLMVSPGRVNLKNALLKAQRL